MARRLAALALAFLLTPPPAGAAEAADRPVAVSPGHPSRMARVSSPCPTFSWGQVAGADRYDLVVYRIAGDGEEAPVALRQAVDGRAGSWTPTLGRCLEPGGRYAWSLRARLGEGVSAWSAPALFEVAPGSSVDELEEALALLRARAGGGSEAPAGAGGTPPGDAAATAAGRAGRRRSGNRQTATTAARPADSSSGLDPVPVGLSVEGRVEADAFSGDGSGLANVQAAGLGCAGCVAVGELADGAVTAAKIGASCAPGQVLMRGAAGWECATLAAPACVPGDELACYTGPAGSRGVGVCVGGIRVCAADSSWGPCAGEVTPAAAESCNGLDDTCDGAVDEGDPTLLCPPTANVATTLCAEASCAITGCDPLWADADGVYVNGCEAPAPGACLEDGAPRPIVGPGEGELVITELLADPAAPLSDAGGEWFEAVALADVDLNGVGIGTTVGTVVDEIGGADCRRVETGDLLVFARSPDPAVNGGLAPDATFGFSLVNGGGSLHLAREGDLVDAVSWSAAQVEAGRALSLPPGVQSAAANDDPASWCVVPADPALLYADGNHGTPGLVNGACP